MALVRGPSAQPQQAYSNKVLEGETVVSNGGIATPVRANSVNDFVTR